MLNVGRVKSREIYRGPPSDGRILKASAGNIYRLSVERTIWVSNYNDVAEHRVG
jgi:hypothetical protein